MFHVYDLEKKCNHMSHHTTTNNGLKKDHYPKLSLQKFCINTLEDNLSPENVFNVKLG